MKALSIIEQFLAQNKYFTNVSNCYYYILYLNEYIYEYIYFNQKL